MGQTYLVHLTLKYMDEQAVIDKMKQFIESDERERTTFTITKPLDEHNIEDLVKVFLTDNEFKKDGDTYTTSFDACYGWEGVMTRMFEFIAPSLGSGSKLKIYPDNDYDLLIVENGKAIWKH